MFQNTIFQAFAIKTAAVVTEALPFILIGSLVSAFIHVYVPAEKVKERMPSGTFGQILYGISMSVFLPTCECGIVPVVRGLAAKGVPAPAAAAYLIAAPVINPLTVLSTYIGFRGSVPMTISRVLISLVAAFAAGYLFAAFDKPFRQTPEYSCSCSCGHHHHHKKGRLVDFVAHGRDDFFSTLSYLIVGAMFAAAFQIFTPQLFLDRLTGSGLLSVAVMMIFAVVLSVCAEADSFVAASFVRFSTASQLAFVGIGSMFDLKLLFMYQSIFSKKVTAALVGLVCSVVFIMCVFLSFAGLVRL